MKHLRIFASLALAIPAAGFGQAKKELPRTYAGPATVTAITPGDLMTRLYKFADDSMMGRLAGTIYNEKGTNYIASELKRIGLQPGGDNGTYVQKALSIHAISANTSLSIDGAKFTLWKDFAPRDQGNGARAFDGANVVFGGMVKLAASGQAFDWSELIDSNAVRGKVVLLTLQKGPDGKAIQALANRAQLTRRFSSASAIVIRFLNDLAPEYIQAFFIEPQVMEKSSVSAPDVPSYFYVTDAVAAQLLGSDPDKAASGAVGNVVHGAIKFGDADAPGGNVIGILPGSDPVLKNQYVVIGAHNDHIGTANFPVETDSIRARDIIVRPQGEDSDDPPDSLITADKWKTIRHMIDSMRTLHGGPRMDSIANGADDDGSGSMSVLEIAEAFAKSAARPKRSIAFVWHVGEEAGLWGSEYFTDHPTIPRDSIVAELNMDMVGRGGANDVTGEGKDGSLLRGGPNYLQVVGSRRLSKELGDLAETVNTEGKFGIKFDYAMDADGHPQNIYCRSDHYEYARYGIPIAFFTTGGHADYHQVTDEPQYIDYDRMSLVANYVKALATRVANLDHRLVVDKPKPDPRGTCRQ